MAVRLRALVLFLVTACGAAIDDPGTPEAPGGNGTDGKGDGSTPGTLSTASQFLRAIGKLQCDHAFTCRASFPGNDNAFINVFGATPDDCYADSEDFYQPDEVDDQVHRAKIAYDPAAAAKCVAGTTLGTDCDMYWNAGTQFDPACNDAVVGKVDDGDDCETVFDCAGADSSCDLDIGVCVPE